MVRVFKLGLIFKQNMIEYPALYTPFAQEKEKAIYMHLYLYITIN